MATKKKVAKKKVVYKKAQKKKVAKKKVAKKTTTKKAAKKATPKRRPVVKRSNESTITSTSVKTAYQVPSEDSKRTAAERKSNVEQPREDVMADSVYSGSIVHQTERQEATFQRILRDLSATGPAGDEFRRKVIEESELEHYDLSAEQQVALVAVGHAAGLYQFVPGMGFCCCCG